MRVHLFGVHHAGDAVEPDPVAADSGSLKVTKIPPGSATPLASSTMYSIASGRVSREVTDSTRSSRELAADTTVGQADCVAIHSDHEIGIDVDGTKIVHEDRRAAHGPPSEFRFGRARFPRAKEAGEDGQWHGQSVVDSHLHRRATGVSS